MADDLKKKQDEAIDAIDNANKAKKQYDKESIEATIAINEYNAAENHFNQVKESVEENPDDPYLHNTYLETEKQLDDLRDKRDKEVTEADNAKKEYDNAEANRKIKEDAYNEAIGGPAGRSALYGAWNTRTVIPSNDIEQFTQERLAYLYNLEPTQDNMFICSVIAPPNKSSGVAYGEASIEGDNWHARKLYSAPYRLYAADFHLPKISFERDNRLRRHFPKSVEMSSEFTLSWIEDCFHSIRKYHHDWFNCWYQREYDGWALGANEGGANGRFRSMKIYMYHMTPQSDGSVKPCVWGYIDIMGAVPCGLGDIKLGPESGDSIYTCTYVSDYIDLRFCDSTGVGNRGDADATDKHSKNILFDNGISSLKLMGFSDEEVKRFKSQFGLRNEKGGESFLS